MSPVPLYYELHGETGVAVTLLHGGFGGAHSWAQQLPALKPSFRVFVPEMRGRGRTRDEDGPITYDAMTDDTIAFIEGVVRAPCAIVGASDGGNVGLMTALRRPDLVQKLVVIGANFHYSALLPAAGWTSLPADDEAWAGPRSRYEALSPDGPDHWAVLHEKLVRMWQQEPTLTTDDVGKIQIAVLVIAADDDLVPLAHTVALYEALPVGQLAIIPGTSHASFVEKPDIVNRLIVDFLLETGPPETMLPIRRAAG
jgi:pimeloyl-ACP methyl ester carboxylesterase